VPNVGKQPRQRVTSVAGGLALVSRRSSRPSTTNPIYSSESPEPYRLKFAATWRGENKMKNLCVLRLATLLFATFNLIRI
jgi:hypothetical protein